MDNHKIRPTPLSPSREAKSGESKTKTLANYVQHYRMRLMREEDLEELVNLDHQRLRLQLEGILAKMMREEGVVLPPAERYQLLTHLIDEAAGYGPLQRLMMDPGVTEIMVNSPREIWVERDGRLERRTDVSFIDDDHILHHIERIVSRLGRRIDESNPWVDARMPNGDRVNAIIPPLSLNGPVLTIRRFRSTPFTLDGLVQTGMLSSDMAEFLTSCVKARLNILVAGGTGSGKTTMLNALGAFIPPGERLVIVEDSAELQVHRVHPHVIRLETKRANVEGRGEITIRQLVRNALRMRPDRIIVGEVRGAEALDMIQAMNTGHEGSMTTVHANSPEEALFRLETMIKWAEGATDLPLEAIRAQLAGALDIILYLTRLQDGSRKVTYISEIKEMRHGKIVVRDIFTFNISQIDEKAEHIIGTFSPTGVKPVHLSRLRRHAANLSEFMFTPDFLMQDFGREILQDPQVTEIMVNAPDQIYIERAGKMQRMAHIRFRDEQHLISVINAIVAPLGRRVDERTPLVDARLPDGSRVNAVIPPVAVQGPNLTIRRFPQDPLTIDDLIRNGALTFEMSEFLEACVLSNLNILVTGGTGTGKTTMLNALSSFIPELQRIVTIEDTAELRPQQPHVISLEAQQADEFGEGAVSIRDLVRNALRMRPDRIIVGEVRGAEAYDMIQSMNTGHDGSMSTIHANSTADGLSRLESLVLQANVDLPHQVVRSQISHAIHVIIHLNRIGGSRLVWQISELLGLKDGEYIVRDVFRFDHQGLYEKEGILFAEGQHLLVGYRPRAIDQFAQYGIKLQNDLFGKWYD